MTTSVRKADMYPCSSVLFILELEAVINYLGLRQPWTPYIPFTPGEVGGLTLSILLFFLCCWVYWWSQISKYDKSSCSAPWSPAATAGRAGLRVRAQKKLFRKNPTCFPWKPLFDFTCFLPVANFFSSVRAWGCWTCCLLVSWKRRSSSHPTLCSLQNEKHKEGSKFKHGPCWSGVVLYYTEI